MEGALHILFQALLVGRRWMIIKIHGPRQKTIETSCGLACIMQVQVQDILELKQGGRGLILVIVAFWMLPKAAYHAFLILSSLNFCFSDIS